VQGLEGKNLIIVAGKGGVGKTTCSAAIALHLAKQGRKTLLVTVDPAKRLEDSLGVPVGHTETPIQPRLVAMMLDPATVIREHLKREVPEADVTEHPMFRYVTNYLPGLNELMAIGKLNDLRRAEKFDVIVVDTAPTGHALSFLSAPKAIEELMSEKSLLKWAVRGYGVWQKVSGAARSAQNLFRKKAEHEAGPPDIDFERIFADIEAEAKRIRRFLTDPKHSALVLVTLPEKLPVEETADLHAAVTGDLGMTVHAIVANKMQPDALAGVQERFDAVAGDAAARAEFTRKAAKATGEEPGLVEALLSAAEFSEVRRAMNVENLAELERRLPGIPVTTVPLFRLDVQGLKSLRQFADALFDPANLRPGRGQPRLR
jgi:TRC40/GET3/ArsA family transport-energizing ATPase